MLSWLMLKSLKIGTGVSECMQIFVVLDSEAARHCGQYRLQENGVLALQVNTMKTCHLQMSELHSFFMLEKF